MFKTLAISTTAITLIGGAALAGSPLASTGQVDSQTYGVPIEITIEPEVSVSAAPGPIELTMNGADANNSATAESTITYLGNVDANIRARLDGDLPDPIDPGGGVNFFLFHEKNAADAVTAITGNASTPSGAVAWGPTDEGTDRELIAATGVQTSAKTDLITYASAAPGEIPLPSTFDLTMTYTIAPN